MVVFAGQLILAPYFNTLSPFTAHESSQFIVATVVVSAVVDSLGVYVIDY